MSNIALNPSELDPDYERIMELFDHRCVVCGRMAVTVHEIEPKSRGRQIAMQFENRISICHPCHVWVHEHNTKQTRDELREMRAKYAKG